MVQSLKCQKYPTCRKLHSDDGEKRAEVCAESSRWPKWLPELEYATAYMCFKFSKFGKAGQPARQLQIAVLLSNFKTYTYFELSG